MTFIYSLLNSHMELVVVTGLWPEGAASDVLKTVSHLPASKTRNRKVLDGSPQTDILKTFSVKVRYSMFLLFLLTKIYFNSYPIKVHGQTIW